MFIKEDLRNLFMRYIYEVDKIEWTNPKYNHQN